MSHLLLLTLALTADPASPAKPPEPGYAWPAGARAGTTVEVTLGGYDWTTDTDFLLDDPRIQVEVLTPPGPVLVMPPPYWFGPRGALAPRPQPRERRVRLTIPADLPPGLVDWRTVNAGGMGTTTGRFAIGTLPEVNEAATGPTVLPSLPVVANGRLSRNEDMDLYQFTPERDGPLTLDLQARQLGSPFKAAITLLDASGTPLLDRVDTEGRDLRATVAVKAKQTYTLRLHDFDYGGDFGYVYRLTLLPAPDVQAIIPAAGPRGQSAEIEFLGPGLATGSTTLESVRRTVAFPADTNRATFPYRLETPHGTTLPFEIPLGDAPEPLLTQTALTVPGAWTVLLDEPAPRSFTLEAIKGTTYDVGARSERLDLSLTVAGPDGKELLRVDDTPEGRDPLGRFVARETGPHTLTLDDVSGLPRDRTAVARLWVRPETPGFQLSLTTGTFNIPLGGRVDVPVKMTRQGGFLDPVALTVTGLPPGVTVAEPVTIAAKQQAGKLTLVCADNAALISHRVRIEGVAKIGEVERKEAAIAPVITPVGPGSERTALLWVTTALKPRLSARVVEADGGRKVHAGTTHPAEIALERVEGFTGPVTLDMAATQSYQRQGIRGPVMEVPADKTTAHYPCWLPEWLETTRTSRIGIVAVVNVKDAQGRERQLLHPVTGYVTMSVQGPILKVLAPTETLVAQAGEKITIPVRLLRASLLPGPVQVELLPPAGVNLTMPPAVTLPPDRLETSFEVALPNAGPLPEELTFTLRATGATGPGLPVRSESGVEVEILNR